MSTENSQVGSSPALCAVALDESSSHISEPSLDIISLTPELIDAGYVDVTPDKDGGVLKLLLQQGIGPELPVAHDHIFVHYTASLTNGKQYHDSRNDSRPFIFIVGRVSRHIFSPNVIWSATKSFISPYIETAIRGLEVGVKSMTRNEIALLQIRSDYAYGQAGKEPHIPPNATLVFEVELLDFFGDDISEKNNGILFKSRLVRGEEFGSPNEASECDIHIVGKLDGRVFEDRDVSFVLGEGCESGVVDGVELGLRRMTQGEISRLRVHSDLAYGHVGCAELEIPPEVNLDFEVHLKSFVKGMEFFDLDTAGKLEHSRIAKQRGTDFFNRDRIKAAKFHYGRVVEFLQFSDNLGGEQGLERDKLLLAAHLNMALCYLKMAKCKEALESAGKALEIDGKNTKALFRRSMAFVGLQEYEKATEGFKAVLDIDSTNRAARTELNETIRLMRLRLEKEKQIYAGMFDKFAKQDSDRLETGKDKSSYTTQLEHNPLSEPFSAQCKVTELEHHHETPSLPAPVMNLTTPQEFTPGDGDSVSASARKHADDSSNCSGLDHLSASE